MFPSRNIQCTTGNIQCAASINNGIVTVDGYRAAFIQVGNAVFMNLQQIPTRIGVFKHNFACNISGSANHIEEAAVEFGAVFQSKFAARAGNRGAAGIDCTALDRGRAVEIALLGGKICSDFKVAECADIAADGRVTNDRGIFKLDIITTQSGDINCGFASDRNRAVVGQSFANGEVTFNADCAVIFN